MGFLGDTVIVVPLCEATKGVEEEEDILRWEKECTRGKCWMVCFDKKRSIEEEMAEVNRKG